MEYIAIIHNDRKSDKTEHTHEKVNGIENVTTETEISQAVEAPVTEAAETQTQKTVYTPIDIRL